MNIDTGGPAFPVTFKTHSGWDAAGQPIHIEDIHGGMTMRDHFAGLAMQTLIALAWERSGDTNFIIDNDGRLSLHARAYEHADAMLKARMK